MKIPSTTALYEGDAYEKSFEAKIIGIEKDTIFLDRTYFYPLGGGQEGDTGIINVSGQTLIVTGTYRHQENSGIIVHKLSQEVNKDIMNQAAIGTLDWDKRYRLMRMHTAIHLLCSLVDAPVTGCNISSEKGRIDFDLENSTLDKETITARLNELVSQDMKVIKHRVPQSDFSTALKLVRTKYAMPPLEREYIELVKIGDIDTQPCGGTHVNSTKEIGSVICTKIEKKGRQNRRIHLTFPLE